MAQISFRLSDESKMRADKVLEQHGYSVGSYLQGIVEYIAQNGTLPVVIEFRPVALNPEEVFQEAIFQFREAYVNWRAFCRNELQVGQMTPLDKLRPHINAIDAAYEFYQQNEPVIRQAPSQMQNITGGDPFHSAMFSRCIEYFPSLVGCLRKAVSCVPMNNRQVQRGDLDEMEPVLAQAAKAIDELQAMTNTTVSAETLTRFMLRDIQEALACATESTREHIPYMIARAWQQRMALAVGEAEKKYKRLGTSEQDVALARLRHDTRLLATKVTEYVETTSEPMTGFDADLLDQVVAYFHEVVSLSGCVSVSVRTDTRQPGHSGNESA
ncbi:type II toxin-antitoxin system RelB/DinJ family antitoxin [Escherichia coli]|nr:type II toxin-antitoxin system RelB/DinJ family antitoxin [Escherichia coli]